MSVGIVPGRRPAYHQPPSLHPALNRRPGGEPGGEGAPRAALYRHRFRLLAGLTLLALLLRIWALDQSPLGLDPGEASIGYNAYSVLRTGRDEYG